MTNKKVRTFQGVFSWLLLIDEKEKGSVENNEIEENYVC